MTQTSRELVQRCLKFEHPQRVPRDLWVLPWARDHYPEPLAEIEAQYPGDFINALDVYKPSPRVKGDPYEIGTYVDEWGCSFINIQKGVIGEVRDPLLKDIGDWQTLKPPFEILPDDMQKARDQVNAFCHSTDKFVTSGCCPRPWERYQFVRGTVNAMMDIMDADERALRLLKSIHDFYLKEVEFWTSTDIDAIFFMDDWGAQSQLLIPPALWHEIFKPLYIEYVEMAHAANKFIFMHSDGHIEAIYPALAEIGVDAVNSQLFCMDFKNLAESIKGKLTFWGEIDRQHILSSPDPDVGRKAVESVVNHLYDPAGGVIAQLEFGAGANPDTVKTVFQTWEELTG
jgi:hypothetical protein